MSILVKGMKMPNKCEDCPLFNVDPGGCGVTKYFIFRKWGERKPCWCPLVEVPDVETADNWYCAGGEWDGPVINPCRGCTDYDGKGGCISNGGCGTRKDEVEE